MNAEHQITSDKSRATPACDIQGQARHGFSLTEVLLAVGTLAVGMLFIAGVFPVSIHFTTVASERTIAATVADEAFAKIKLYGISDVNLSYSSQNLYENVAMTRPPDGEFAYPSIPTSVIAAKKYWWSAICRKSDPLDPHNVQITVFVSRKTGAATKYYKRSVLPPLGLSTIDWPVPVFVSVIGTVRPDELLINDSLNVPNFINDGYTIVDDATGNIYRVLERYSATPNVIRLDRNWQGPLLPLRVWTIPASVSSLLSRTTTGRYPCIAVYQKVMRF